jgi:hypothetical protein
MRRNTRLETGVWVSHVSDASCTPTIPEPSANGPGSCDRQRNNSTILAVKVREERHLPLDEAGGSVRLSALEIEDSGMVGF